jgi:peptide/nickel transport system permease protein
VMGYLLVTSVIIIVFNLVADILYGFLDPRIRYD